MPDSARRAHLSSLQLTARSVFKSRPPRKQVPGTPGEFWWSGAANTTFWVDPKEDLAVVFMTQVKGSPHEFHIRRDLRTLVYSAFTESYA